eukprot:scaffold73498_cov103-Cyclotella_meneghiniana.AAC.1
MASTHLPLIRGICRSSADIGCPLYWLPSGPSPPNLYHLNKDKRCSVFGSYHLFALSAWNLAYFGLASLNIQAYYFLAIYYIMMPSQHMKTRSCATTGGM